MAVTRSTVGLEIFTVETFRSCVTAMYYDNYSQFKFCRGTVTAKNSNLSTVCVSWSSHVQ